MGVHEIPCVVFVFSLLLRCIHFLVWLHHSCYVVHVYSRVCSKLQQSIVVSLSIHHSCVWWCVQCVNLWLPPEFSVCQYYCVVCGSEWHTTHVRFGSMYCYGWGSVAIFACCLWPTSSCSSVYRAVIVETYFVTLPLCVSCLCCVSTEKCHGCGEEFPKEGVTILDAMSKAWHVECFRYTATLWLLTNISHLPLRKFVL